MHPHDHLPNFILQSFRYDDETRVLHSTWNELGRKWSAVTSFKIIGKYETLEFFLQGVHKILGSKDVYIYVDLYNRFEVRIST